MSRRRIPLAGRRQPRINVGKPLGDKAEFERASNRDMLACADRLLEIVRGRLIEVRFRRDRVARLPERARSDGAPRAALFQPRPLPDQAAVEPVGQGAWLEEAARGAPSLRGRSGRRATRSRRNRISTRRPRTISSRRSAHASMSRSEARSNSASSPRGAPTFIRACRRPASGIRRRAMPCCLPPAAASTVSTGAAALWQDRLPQPRLLRHRRLAGAADRAVPRGIRRRRRFAAGRLGGRFRAHRPAAHGLRHIGFAAGRRPHRPRRRGVRATRALRDFPAVGKSRRRAT